jgi:opacity protein-like surface antigen
MAAVSLAAPANAGNFYVSVFGGANFLEDESFFASRNAGDTTFAFASDGDTGFIVGGAVGMNLNQFLQGLRVEAEVAYRLQNVGGPWGTTTFVLGSSSGNLDYDQSTLSVMANVWYDFQVAGLKPYVGGGIGWARHELDGHYNTTGGSSATVLNFDDSGFAWQLGAGLNFDISPNMALGIGYRYFQGPDVTVVAPFNTLTGNVEDRNQSVLINLTVGM